MHAYRMRSGISRKGLMDRLDSVEGLAVRTGAVGSEEELQLAFHLAKGSFSKKTNIARSMRYEFLLWLLGKTDIKSAMKESAPDSEEFFVIVFSETRPDAVCRLLEAELLPLNLEKEGEPLALERISLSRIS
ncbi:MAG: hypothetical protein AB1295_03030 [Candidatus Micrarchaeota archaeon]